MRKKIYFKLFYNNKACFKSARVHSAKILFKKYFPTDFNLKKLLEKEKVKFFNLKAILKIKIWTYFYNL